MSSKGKSERSFANVGNIFLNSNIHVSDCICSSLVSIPSYQHSTWNMVGDQQ